MLNKIAKDAFSDELHKIATDLPKLTWKQKTLLKHLALIPPGYLAHQALVKYIHKKYKKDHLDKQAADGSDPIKPSTEDEIYYNTKLGKDPSGKEQKGFYFRSSNDLTLKRDLSI